MIEHLELRNFRNHNHTKINFQSEDTFIEGLNGSGKTSIVEAINYVSTLKSFKTTDEDSLLQKDKQYFKIILKTKKDEYEIVYNNGKKLLKINNNVYKKMSEFIANFKSIIFSPEDLNLVTGSPSVRRNFLDMVMVQINKDLLTDLNTYKKVLKERNALLKNLKENSDMTFLKIINKRLQLEADKIIEKRQTFINNLNIAFKKRFKAFNKTYEVGVIYEPNVGLNALEDVLNRRIKSDIISETTNSGPHRDELLIMFNNNLAKQFASQGQIRLITISLKLALIDLHEKKEDIVILLDDVLSELDDEIISEMRKLLYLKNQVIITGTNNKYKEMKVLNLNKRRSETDEW